MAYCDLGCVSNIDLLTKDINLDKITFIIFNDVIITEKFISNIHKMKNLKTIGIDKDNYLNFIYDGITQIINSFNNISYKSICEDTVEDFTKNVNKLTKIMTKLDLATTNKIKDTIKILKLKINSVKNKFFVELSKLKITQVVIEHLNFNYLQQFCHLEKLIITGHPQLIFGTMNNMLNYVEKLHTLKFFCCLGPIIYFDYDGGIRGGTSDELLRFVKMQKIPFNTELDGYEQMDKRYSKINFISNRMTEIEYLSTSSPFDYDNNYNDLFTLTTENEEQIKKMITSKIFIQFPLISNKKTSWSSIRSNLDIYRSMPLFYNDKDYLLLNTTFLPSNLNNLQIYNPEIKNLFIGELPHDATNLPITIENIYIDNKTNINTNNKIPFNCKIQTFDFINFVPESNFIDTETNITQCVYNINKHNINNYVQNDDNLLIITQEEVFAKYFKNIKINKNIYSTM